MNFLAAAMIILAVYGIVLLIGIATEGNNGSQSTDN
jgi:hypothetical protein